AAPAVPPGPNRDSSPSPSTRGAGNAPSRPVFIDNTSVGQPAGASGLALSICLA
ncbi:hypothetical protein ABVK25_005329, partial [Lepraria finkii]